MKSIGGNAVLLSLPYQINSLPGHVRLLMCKGNETKIEIGEQMLLIIPLENGGNAVLLTLPYQIIGERAKRARHSQVCSIENQDIYIIVRTYVTFAL